MGVNVLEGLFSIQSYRTMCDVAMSADPTAPSMPSRTQRTRWQRKRRLKGKLYLGMAASAPRRVFVEDTLQGSPMHFEAPGGLGDITSALFKHPLDVFPAHSVCRHWVLGWTGQ